MRLDQLKCVLQNIIINKVLKISTIDIVKEQIKWNHGHSSIKYREGMDGTGEHYAK